MDIDMKQAVQARAEAERASTPPPETGPAGITPEFIYKCLNANEQGDADLYKKLFQGEYVFSKAADSWLTWAGSHWQTDKMNYAMASVEGVALTYEEQANALQKEIKNMNDGDSETAVKYLQSKIKKLIQRASALRTDGRRRRVLQFVHTSKNPMAIHGDELDKKPWLMACKNGVINLQTGELQPGKHTDWMLKASPVEWSGIDTPAPVWKKTLLEIFSDKQQLVDCFQRICGYAMVGMVSESILVVMTGRGRNGKSLIVETLSKVLGPLSGAIRAEMLLDQYRVANSAGPTPDIMTLRGLRMAFASETDDGCRVSSSKVKWLTGNDTITGRNPHDKHEVQFKPSHTLFLLTNHKPHANAEDFAFWERMVLLPFDLSFVDRDPQTDQERRADRKLPEKLEAELPGIMAWMVRGCLDWQVRGVAPPAAVKAAVSEYKREEDTLGDFIAEACVVDPYASVGATEVYKVFEEWWRTNVSNKIPKQKWFGSRMTRRFEKKKDGTVKYIGVGLLDTGNGYGIGGYTPA